MAEKKTVLVAGASSQLGVFLLPRLQMAGLRVWALSRGTPVQPVQVSDSVSWCHPDAWPAQSENTDYLVSCGPIDLAGKLILQNSGFGKAVVFSTSSVLSKGDSSDPEERRHMAELIELERSLVELCEGKAIDLLLLRPTLIYGCGLDRNVSMLAALGDRLGFIPLAGDAAGLRQPVHADDLAALAVRALTSETRHVLESQACGGSTLTYRDMAQRVADSRGRSVRLVTLPEWLLAGAVRVLSLMKPWKGLNPEMVRRQNRDLVFDDSVLRETLAYDPRPFRPTPSDFEVPDFAKELQLGDPTCDFADT